MIRWVALVALLATPAFARVALVEGETVTVDLGGYLRMFSAWQRIAEIPSADLSSTVELSEPLELAVHASIVRAELKAGLGEHVTVEAHSRLQWNQGQATLAGAGVTPTPSRTVDTESELVETADATLTHDLDRAVLRLYLGEVDLSLGRQAVTWGTSNVFGVADVWTQFSPFDVDTSQKRGVDAARAVMAVGQSAELDAVVVDRGSQEDLSGGLRGTLYLPFGDAYVAGAKLWEELAVMGGLSTEVDAFKLRSEALWAWDTDDDEAQRPRVTLGVDWFYSGDLLLGLEGHYNGPGTDLEALERGELYLIDRWYAGGYSSYKLHDLVTATLSPLVNLTDPSALLGWGLSCSIQQDVDVGLGGFHGVGDGLEFGAYPQVVYLQLSAFL